jgi:hypothetical protein
MHTHTYNQQCSSSCAVVRRSSLAGDRQAGKRTLPGAPIVVSWLVCVTARHEIN